MAADPINIILSIDVEEEGLFGGAYHRGATVRNVAALERLLPLLDEFSLPITLLCTHSVFADQDARRVIDRLRQRGNVEIGAHLHHWNTPPLGTETSAYISPGSLPQELFGQRLSNLFLAGNDFCGTSMTSFRMGKWDLHRWHWPYLVEAGVTVDASVRPLHYGPVGRPDHFAAPADPYAVSVNGQKIIEVPLTATPLYSALPGHIAALASFAPAKAFNMLKTSVQKWSALAMLPIYHPLWAMRLIAGLHMARGGRFLSLAWHSSEMMPGGAPHMPDDAAVAAFMRKVRAFLLWLSASHAINGLTLKDLAKFDVADAAGTGMNRVDKTGDWKYN